MSEGFGDSEICKSRVRRQFALSMQFVKQIPFVTRQVYKHTCQNVSEKKSLSLHCCKMKSNLFVCLLGICQVFSVSCKIVLVTTNCCFMRSDIMLHSSFLS